jgi:hypothetical protein
LTDDGLYERILNEGATRGLPELFTESTEHLRRPATICISVTGTSDPLTCICLRSHDASPTGRPSRLVARTANCLKLVGYFIGPIEVWDGAPPRPKPPGPSIPDLNRPNEISNKFQAVCRAGDQATARKIRLCVALRDLPELFTESTERLGLPVGDASWLRRQMHVKGSEVPVTELSVKSSGRPRVAPSLRMRS